MKVSTGTEPGTFEADMKPKMPSIAARPLLISMSRPRALLLRVHALPERSKRVEEVEGHGVRAPLASAYASENDGISAGGPSSAGA